MRTRFLPSCIPDLDLSILQGSFAVAQERYQHTVPAESANAGRFQGTYRPCVAPGCSVSLAAYLTQVCTRHTGGRSQKHSLLSEVRSSLSVPVLVTSCYCPESL